MKIPLILLATTALMASAPAFARSVPAVAHESALEAEVDTLKAQIAAQAAQLAAIQAQLQAMGTAQQSQARTIATQGQTVTAIQTAQTIDATSAGKSATAGTTIGGYGEIAFNGYTHNASRNQADLKRFVLFFGHRFNDKLSFMSEVEWEHAVTSSSDAGEAEIEQAYLNYKFSDRANIKAGLFLMPFGFINRNHEPPVFYGVERNEVERRIIPSTWREGGIGLYGQTKFGLHYDVGITTGFNAAKLDDASAPLLGTHQELQLAKAANPSFYGALEYSGIPGVLVGGAIFTGKTTHANANFRADNTQPDFAGIGGQMTLWDVHARVQRHGFDIQALYARGHFAESDKLDVAIDAYNIANPTTTRPYLPTDFYGWLVQGAYTFNLGGDLTLSPFARYEMYNTQAKLPLGFTADPANRDRVVTTGISFKPMSDVVLKADFQHYIEHKDNDRINLGLGYQF